MRNLAFILLAGAALPAAAGENPAELDQVVITATRSEVTLSSLPASAIVINRDSIERMPGASVADLLRLHAGLDIAANGGPGAPMSLFLRGTESNHVLLLVDGIEMNPGSIGGPALQHIPLESIERIEIIKGPRSALYGSDAIGGVINVITRQSDATRWSVAATAGSFATHELNASAFGAGDGWHWGIDLGRHETDGFPPRADSDIDRGYEREQLNARLGWRGERFSAEARHWQSEGVIEYLGFMLEPLSQDFTNTASSLDLRWSADQWAARLLLGNSLDELEQREPDAFGGRDFVATDRDTADLKLDAFHFDAHLLTLGLYTENTDVTAATYAAKEKARALYLQDVFTGDRHSVLATLRFNDYDNFGREFTWNLGWNRELNGSGSLFLAAGTAFRAPDATDRFGFGGNPGLEPEESASFEAGYRHAFSDTHSLSIAVFRNDIDELIAFVDPDGFEGPEPGANENIERARIEGVELVHEWSDAQWQWRLEASVQDPRDELTGSLLARRAKRSITASLVRNIGNVEIGIDGLARSERLDSPYTGEMLPGHGVLGASFRWFMHPDWSLGLRVENLTDRLYQTAAGYNTAERSYYLTLRYSH